MIQDYNGQFAAVAEVFYEAVHRTAAEHYTAEQINAWAPLPIDYDRWRVRCEQKRPYLYCRGDVVCGFIELDTDGHIDCHYVHPDYNRMGIGSALLRHVLQIAADLELPKLFVEASHVAKGLYLKHGFDVIRANDVRVGNVSMQNWMMERLP